MLKEDFDYRKEQITKREIFNATVLQILNNLKKSAIENQSAQNVILKMSGKMVIRLKVNKDLLVVNHHEIVLLQRSAVYQINRYVS